MILSEGGEGGINNDWSKRDLVWQDELARLAAGIVTIKGKLPTAWRAPLVFLVLSHKPI